MKDWIHLFLIIVVLVFISLNIWDLQNDLRDLQIHSDTADTRIISVMKEGMDLSLNSIDSLRDNDRKISLSINDIMNSTSLAVTDLSDSICSIWDHLKYEKIDYQKDQDKIRKGIKEQFKKSIQYTDTMLQLEKNRVSDLCVETFFSFVTIEALVPEYDPWGMPTGEFTWFVFGSGVVLTDQGLILTAGHVLDPNPYPDYPEFSIKDFRVKVANGNTFEIKNSAWFNIDEGEIDLGLIQIDLPNNYCTLDHVYLGDMGNLKVGQDLIVVGNPFGFKHSITKGILSRIGWEEFSEVSKQLYIQTDAPVNGGNSGGPIFGLDGRLYGICSWGVDRSDGISFFVPVNVIKRTIPKLLQKMYEDN